MAEAGEGVKITGIVGDPVTGDSGAAVSGGDDYAVTVVTSGAVPNVAIRSILSGSDGGGGGSYGGGGGGYGGGGGGGSGPNLTVYNIDIEEIKELTDDPKKEKIKKLAKNCSQGNKELCGWIMHKFGKIKEANHKGYNIILGYEYNATSKARKSNKPIFGVIIKTEDSKKLKEIPVPKSCGDCVVPTVWRNNGEEKCFNMSEKIKPIHFCVKPCKEYLFQIFILKISQDNEFKKITSKGLNGYENAQNYELLNRIGQIMKPKLFWAKILNTEKNNEFLKVNELSLNLSKININFPVFSDFLDLNKGSQEKVRNLLMTPEIIEFYVENPGLVTREVKQLLIALSDCYDVAKRYTGIFCKIAIDEDKINKYGGGGSDIIDNACKKLLKEKKIGRFNEEFVIPDYCGGGGGVKRQKVLHDTAYDDVGSIEYENLVIAQITQGKILNWDIEIGRLEEYKKNNSTDNTAIQQCDASIKILEEQKTKSKQMLDDESKKYIARRSEEKIDIQLEKSYTGNPLFFLQNENNSCWIDSIIYFLFAIDKYEYFFKPLYNTEFTNIGKYIRNNDIKNFHGPLNWKQNFLRILLNNNYQRNGFNDVAEVANVIFDTTERSIILDERTDENQINLFDSSQYLLSNGRSSNLNQNNFFQTLFPNYIFVFFPRNLILQNPTNHQSQFDSNVGGPINYLRSLLFNEIKIRRFYKRYSKLNKNLEATYKLVSFIVNTGDGIHFICYFLKETQWWKYDDTNTEHKFEKKNNLNSIQTEIASKNRSKIVLYNYEYISNVETA